MNPTNSPVNSEYTPAHMENQPEKIVLPNLTKTATQTTKNKTLTKAIDASDLSYIQEFLLSEAKNTDISALSKYYKCRLLPLLVEFLDQPLRLEAIGCIHEIMTDTGNVDVFSRILVERSIDFNKLIFLKGKIDYLKYLQKPKIDDNVENTYVETD